MVSSVVERLMQSLQGVHAVLFYGPEGGGMQESGMALAQGWLCKSVSDGKACGVCGNCKTFLSGRNVDFIHYRPWGPSNWIKEQAIRRVKPHDDEGPETPLLEFLRTSPLMARHKVALFENADRLLGGASNALLKTVEEPPPHAKIIMTTSDFSRLLPTIRSRCMGVACGYGLNPDQSEMERVFGGSPGLNAQVQSKQEAYAKLWAVLESSRGAPPGAAIKLAEQTRELTEPISKALNLGARTANAEILRCMAQWLLQNRPERPDLAHDAVQSHRLIVGNVNSGALFDLLWSRVLSR